MKDMSSYMIEGDEFSTSEICVRESVYETIIRLEEAKYGLRNTSDYQIMEAIDFLKSRWNWESPYGFERTSFDRELTGGYKKESGERVRSSYVKFPTGEPKYNFYTSFSDQILTWEKDAGTIEETRKYFLEKYPGPYNWEQRAKLNKDFARYYPRVYGYWCCGSCNILYQKTLIKADSEFYYEKEGYFLDNLKERRTERGRWKNYPFFYAILSLDEIGSDGTQEELKTVAESLNPSLSNRYMKEDRASRFRWKSIETLLEYK